MGFFKNREGYYVKYEEEIQEFIVEGEFIEEIYGLVLDYACLTNKRIIFTDKAIGTKEMELISIPYSKVEAVSIIKGKLFSLTNKISIYTKFQNYSLEFIKGANVTEFYKTITKYICD